MSVSDLTRIISPKFSEATVVEIVRKKSNLSNVEILGISIDNGASKKGDSYLSSICRFVVTARGVDVKEEIVTVNIPVIVKFFPKNVARRKTFRSEDFFKTEIYFYEKVWPEMKKVKLAKINEELDEIPLLLASHCDGEQDFIALEDLSHQGFKPFGRSEGITKERLSQLLELLANFHALGIVTRLKNPQFEDIALGIPESYYADKYRNWYENFMNNSMGPQYQKAAKDVLPQEYHEKITMLFSKDLYAEFIKCCSIRDKLCSITQGDAWLPNFLVSNPQDRKSAAVLIDFQLARYAPIPNDLLHFLYSGVPEQILLKHWDDLVAEYHYYLSKRIEELGGEKDYISLQELRDEIQRYPLTGLGMAMESTVMALLTDDEVADIDFLKGENAVPLEDVWILPEFDRSRNEKLAFLIKHFVDKKLI